MKRRVFLKTVSSAAGVAALSGSKMFGAAEAVDCGRSTLRWTIASAFRTAGLARPAAEV